MPRHYGRLELALGLLADQGVNDGFEPLPGSRIAKGQLAHPVTVQRPLGADHLQPKLVGQLTDGRAARRANLAGNQVGVHHDGTAVGQGLGDGAFSAANAARQADALDAFRHAVTYQ